MIGRLHLPLFLFALAAAIVIKVAVHQSLQLTEIIISAQVRYLNPDDVMIIDPVQEVNVRLRGPNSEVAELNPLSVEVEVTIADGELGLVDVSEERIAVRPPGQFEVVSVDPNSFQLNIEPLERRLVDIRVELTGEPAAGAEHGDPRVRPETVTIQGPQSRVRAIDSLPVTVSLDRRAIDFTTMVPIASPDSLVRIDPRQVEVSVAMRVLAAGPVNGDEERGDEQAGDEQSGDEQRNTVPLEEERE